MPKLMNMIARAHRLQAARIDVLLAELDALNRRLGPDGLEAKLEALPAQLAELISARLSPVYASWPRR